MAVKVWMEEEGFQELQDKIRLFGEGAEEIINQTLVNEVKELLTPSIVNFIPVSSRNKKHAKHNNPIMGEQETTLELYLHSKKPYNYLFFPENAHGCKFVGQQPRDFMTKGVEAQMGNAINIMLEKLIKDF